MDQAVFWLLVIGVPSAVYLAGWGLSKVPRVVRGWRYDWAEAKHLTGPQFVYDDPVPDFYGAASLADEEAWAGRGPSASYEEWLAEGYEGDWLAQTRADLAPETLDVSAEVAAVLVAALDDSGPGEAPSVDPGPDPMSALEGQERSEGSPEPDSHPVDMAAGVWFPGVDPGGVSSQGPTPPAPTRLADIGDIMDANLAADVAAYQRAQDDQVRAWCSGWEAERREFTRQLAEAWA